MKGHFSGRTTSRAPASAASRTSRPATRRLSAGSAPLVIWTAAARRALGWTPVERASGGGILSAEILSQIEDVLDQIRPALHADGGDVELVEYDEEGFVHLSMQGSCGGCPMSTATLTLGIEAELRRAIPEVEGVITV
jgi:Fe-S cluster biogenesis protein NfuA